MRSVRTRVAESLVRVAGIKRQLNEVAAAERDRATLDERVARLRRYDAPNVPRSILPGWGHEAIDADGAPLHILTHRKSSTGERIILYLHGGAFMFGPARTEWQMVARVAKKTGSAFALLDYPKAPERVAPAALDSAMRSFGILTEDRPEREVVLMGASAGAAIAVAVMARLRDADRPQPSTAILLSPSVDLTLEEDVSHLESGDLLVSPALVRAAGRLYAGKLRPSHPEVSPTFGNLANLSPMHVFVGTKEILLPGIETFAHRAREAGSEVELIIGEDQQHTWPTLPTPEGRKAQARMQSIIEG